MRYFDSHKKNSTATVQVACAIVFCLFSFSWLYWFQADVLTVAQHALSNGATHYNRTIGAILITLVLYAIQLCLGRLLRLYGRAHALTYLPSMLILAFISDVNADIDLHHSLGLWPWIAPIILILWGGAVWMARQIMPFHIDKNLNGFFSRKMWINLLFMSAMMLTVAAIGNSHSVFHFRTHVETALLRQDVDEALRTGKTSLETDEHLTMLRAYALSLKGKLGESLFEYPIAATGNDLLPLPTSKSRLMLLNSDSLFLHLGAIPRGKMTTDVYYKLLERDSLATPAMADYRLCGLLIDKDIDRFARMLPKYYAINDSLPKHYKEALTLYTHQRGKPIVVYHNAILDEDWSDFQKLGKQHQQGNERKAKVRTRYATSYWYYYFYCHQ